MGLRPRQSEAIAGVGGRVSRLTLSLLFSSLLLASTAHADDSAAPRSTTSEGRRWVPTVSIGMGAFDERLRIRVDGNDYDSTRSQLRTFLALGLSHPVVRLRNDRLWIDGHGSIGAGPTFQTGHWHVPIREDVTFAYAPLSWLTLRAGLGIGVTVDATESRRSFAELGIPLSVTLVRTLELVYRPMLALPLGSDSSVAFGGSRDLSTRLAPLPFELVLRGRFGPLGW
jgi:hypothetical protein